MKTAYLNAEIHIGSGESFLGTLITENDRILSRYEGEITASDRSSVDELVDLKGLLLLPGLVDVHTHGRAGSDFVTATNEDFGRMARSYLKSGVTTLFPTLASAPFDALCDAGDRIRTFCEASDKTRDPLPRFAGIHMEGRYLNPAKRGAHAEDLLVPPDAEELSRLIAHFGDRFHISYAPELDSDAKFLRRATAAGGTVGIAHTNATYEEAVKALEGGAVSFTHTFNAMPPLHHREGGAVAAALTSDAYAELICDGIHVSPEMVRLAFRCKGSEKLVLVTDSMEATDCADGVYSIAGMTCVVKDGKAMTEDGHLAGSTLSLVDAMFHLMEFCSISLDDALPTVTRNPARMVGLDRELGTLDVGKYADLLVLDPSLVGKNAIRRVVVGGQTL